MTNVPVPFGPEEVERLTLDTQPWLSCDDCFEQVDWVAEAVLRKSAALPEPFRVHLIACAVCHEEARSLAALIAPEISASPAESIARLDEAITGSRS